MTTTPRASTSTRATIEDVAEAANVSVATVSRALRGLPNVAASTRRRVQHVADELRYRADPAASRLAAGRAGAIGVVVPFVNSWYCAEVMAGVEAVCAESGYDTIVISLGIDNGERRRIDGSKAMHRRVDGLVIVDIAISDDEVAAVLGHGLGMVSIGPVLPGCASLGVDDVTVGRLATEHLIALGHRRIGIIGDRTDSVFWFVVPQLRQRGYEEACRAAGIEVVEDLFAEGSFTVQGGAEAFEQLMSIPDPPTAVFAIGDDMAFGAVRRARELGVDVPRDVSIIGVDDQPVADVLGLTTVHQDVAEHGAHAARLLIEQLAGNEAITNRFDAAVRLVERCTTAPPPRP